MAQVGLAARVSQNPLNNSTASIESGLPIIVHGIIASATANTTVTVRKPNAGTTLFLIRVPANNTVVCNIPFLCDSGMEINSTGTVDVTVFHSNAGR